MRSAVDSDPAGNPGDLRARRRDQTRAEIHAAAIELSGLHGYDRITVDDIAARAGVSPRTFFRYFSTKDRAVAYDRWGFSAAVTATIAAADPRTLRLADLQNVYLGAIEGFAGDLSAVDALLNTCRVMQAAPQLVAVALAADADATNCAIESITDATDVVGRSRVRLLVVVTQATMAAALAEWVERYPNGPAAPESSAVLLDIFRRLVVELGPERESS